MIAIRLQFVFFVLAGLFISRAGAEEFTVVAYNVENMFDVDGFALYDDYKQGDDPEAYSRRKLLTKLQNTTIALQALPDTDAPEVILFQEFEADFTPESGVDDLDAFLQEYAHTTAAAMLTSDWHADYAGLPAHVWMLKAMADVGLTGYEVAVAPAKDPEFRVAHTCAVFSKFPIREVKLHDLEQARDILEVELDVAGSPLWVYSNHWKSGASNPEREPIRVQNAGVLRGLIDARLAEGPYADIIIGGDLNSHYNHALLYPEIETGINDVLGSQGDERATLSKADPDLYNLWFELSPEERYSEVWRGRRGTLMHLLITRGLYDVRGITYVDGSFNKLSVPDLNTDALGRPLKWNNYAETGGGFSDHLPVYARFTTGRFKQSDLPSKGLDGLKVELPLNYETGVQAELKDAAFLNKLSDNEIAAEIGKVFTAEVTIGQRNKPLRFDLDGVLWAMYCPNKELFNRIVSTPDGERLNLVVTLGVYRDVRQLVVEAIQ